PTPRIRLRDSLGIRMRANLLFLGIGVTTFTLAACASDGPESSPYDSVGHQDSSETSTKGEGGDSGALDEAIYYAIPFGEERMRNGKRVLTGHQSWTAQEPPRLLENPEAGFEAGAF